MDRTLIFSAIEEAHVLWAGSAYCGGRLIFARAAYPGYWAKLNGQPLPVESYLGVLVSVTLPDDASGELRVWFEPPGQTTGWFAVGSGLGLVSVWLLLTGRLPTTGRQSWIW